METKTGRRILFAALENETSHFLVPRACSGPGVREERPQGADIAKDTPDHVLPAGSRRRHRVSTSSRFPRGLLTKAEMPRDAFPRDEGATDTRGECAGTRREAGLTLQGPGARGPPDVEPSPRDLGHGRGRSS